MTDYACPKCGFGEGIPDVKIIDRGDAHSETNFSAAVQAYPSTWLFSGEVSQKFRAEICGSCGYTEFYLENAEKMLAKAKNTASKRTSSESK